MFFPVRPKALIVAAYVASLALTFGCSAVANRESTKNVTYSPTDALPATSKLDTSEPTLTQAERDILSRLEADMRGSNIKNSAEQLNRIAKKQDDTSGFSVLPQSSMPARTDIRTECIAKWGTDYRMIDHCIRKQSEAQAKVGSIPGDQIKSECQAKWGTDYRMVEHCYRKQSEAKTKLGL